MYFNEMFFRPKKSARLDGREGQYRYPPAPIRQEEKLNWLLNLTTDICKTSTEDQDRTEKLFHELTNDFSTLLEDNKITSWGPNMHMDVYSKCKKLVELCVLKMDEDLHIVLRALALVLNPNNEFHTFNAARMSETVQPGGTISDEGIYACPLANPQTCRGWLVDLINSFGDLGGFVILLSRFQPGRRSLNLCIMHGLLQPFGHCHELLTDSTILKYLMPVVERVKVMLSAFTVEKLKEERQSNLSIESNISSIITAMKNILSRVPGQEEVIENLESLKLQLILRLFQTMIELNEPWPKLVLNFNPNTWNHFLESFYTSWKTADEYARNKMILLLQHWAKEYKDGTMIQKVLELFRNLAHSHEISLITSEHVLDVHSRMLFAFNSQERDEQVFIWLEKCLEGLKNNDNEWPLPTLKEIRRIFITFELNNFPNESDDISRLICRLEVQHSLMTLMVNNLKSYMARVHQFACEQSDTNEPNETLMSDYSNRSKHEMQIRLRLDIIDFIVKYRVSLPEIDQVKEIWKCLIEQSVFSVDKHSGFVWFSKFAKHHIYFQRPVVDDFLKQNILRLNPTHLTLQAFECLKTVFENVCRDDKGNFNMNNSIGVEYLWIVVTTSSEEVASQCFELLKKINEHAGLKLKLSGAEIQSCFIAECTKQLQVCSSTHTRLTRTGNFMNAGQKRKEITMEIKKMGRVMKFLGDYVKECDWDGRMGIKQEVPNIDGQWQGVFQRPPSFLF